MNINITKSIDFIFFMSTRWYMKPIVLFSSTLSKHHFAFWNLFRWNNTNEFISIQIIQYQFFRPRIEFIDWQRSDLRVLQTIWTFEESLWYLPLSNHRDVSVRHVNHEFDRIHSLVDEQEPPKSTKPALIQPCPIDSYIIGEGIQASHVISPSVITWHTV